MAGLIQREEFLDYLGVIANDAVEIGIERAGKGLILSAPLQPPVPRQPGQSSRPWVGYQIDPNLSLGIFHLDACYLNDEYTRTVKAFFTEVSEKNIRNIAIDVRRNGGGNSSVINEFFKYLKIDQYRSYSGDVRYSEEIAPKAGYTRTSGYERGKPHRMPNAKVKDTKLLFGGKLFVLTSTHTFSSGNWFAVLVKDNALGTILGEPTGNAPSSYGDSPSFQLPNTGFWFSVSHKKWVRPNPDNDPEDALYPDIPVYTTIEDIIHGADPQLEKLKALVQKGSN
jgi:C-terminal processing protease CtpA/Prc